MYFDVIIILFQHVTQTVGDRTVKIGAVLAVIIIYVTMWMEPVPVNPHRQDKDGKEGNVINVYQDTGEQNVNRDVVLVVIIINVRGKMEPAPVNPH